MCYVTEMFSNVHGPVHGQLELSVTDLLCQVTERKEQDVE